MARIVLPLTAGDKKKMDLKNKKGFTLVEIMTIIVIMGIMGAIAYPSFMKSIKRYKVRNAAADISSHIKLTRSMAMKEATRSYLLTFTPSGNSYSYGYDTNSDSAPDGYGTGPKVDVTLADYSSSIIFGSDASNGPPASTACSGIVPGNGFKGLPGTNPNVSFTSSGSATSTGCVFLKDGDGNNYLVSLESLVGNVIIWHWESGNVWKKIY